MDMEDWGKMNGFFDGEEERLYIFKARKRREESFLKVCGCGPTVFIFLKSVISTLESITFILRATRLGNVS